MGKPDAPEPPDPRETSAAQTGTNVATAVANNYMGLVDQHTPYGSLTYDFEGGQAVPEIVPIRTNSGGSNLDKRSALTGLFSGGSDRRGPQSSAMANGRQSGPTGYSVGEKRFNTLDEATAYRNSLGGGGGLNWTDPYTGQTYNIPKITATQTLSPEEQQKLDLNQQTEINLGTLARDQSAFLNDYMAEPFGYGVGEHEKWAAGLYDDLNSGENDRMFESLNSRLANQGVTAGSEAYDRELANLRESQMDSRNRFMLDSYNTGLQTALTNRNQPINEIIGLLSGTQVQQPNLVNTPTSKIPTTDVAGLINQNYNQRLGAWQQENQNSNSLMGGLFGLGASSITGGLFG